MKAFKISLLVFIVSISVSAQWYQQNSGTTDLLLRIQFVSEQVGWMSTERNLYKTTDSGVNWQLKFTQSNIFIQQIAFKNEDLGWIAILSAGTELLKTSDGGENWEVVYDGASEHIFDFEFINPDTGWIVGGIPLGYLFKSTTNGGMTWMDLYVFPNYGDNLFDIEVINNMNIIILGSGTLFKTSDGGNNWQEYPIQYNTNSEIQFFNMDLGWATKPLYKTTDGGYTWLQQGGPLTTFQFINEQEGWYIFENEIYHTETGGLIWTLQNSNTNNILNDIFFLDNSNGWAVGYNGTLLHTNNGGTPVELV